MRILWQVVGSTLLLILTACSSGSGSQTSVDSKLYDCSEQDQSSIVPIQELYPSIIIQDTLETGVFSFKAKFFADEDAFLNSGEFNFGTGARLGCEDTFSVSVGLDESF